MPPIANNNSTLWLNPEILQWATFSQGGAEPNPTLRSRAYDIWRHAEQILKQTTSDLHLVDVITTLKRSIDQRLRALDGTYSFKTIPIRQQPSELLGALELLEIVRPFMFRKLLEIRNAVEHEDAPPPDLNSSAIFLEFSWYFLKSTDRMLQVVPDKIGLYPPDDDAYSIDLDYGPERNWNPALRGWVKSELISVESKDNWIALSSASSETWGEVKERLQSTGSESLLGFHSRDRQRLDDVYFQGGVRGPQDAMVSLTKIYFSAV